MSILENIQLKSKIESSKSDEKTENLTVSLLKESERILKEVEKTE
jgi:hypothetical protein